MPPLVKQPHQLPRVSLVQQQQLEEEEEASHSEITQRLQQEQQHQVSQLLAAYLEEEQSQLPPPSSGTQLSQRLPRLAAGYLARPRLRLEVACLAVVLNLLQAVVYSATHLLHLLQLAVSNLCSALLQLPPQLPTTQRALRHLADCLAVRQPALLKPEQARLPAFSVETTALQPRRNHHYSD